MDLVLIVAALGFAGMGLVALVRPRAIGGYFDVDFASVDGRNEVRAVYGGFGLAMAGALMLALTMPGLRPGIVACVALALGGMAAGRLLSALVERPGRWPWVFFGIEVVAAGALYGALDPIARCPPLPRMGGSGTARGQAPPARLNPRTGPGGLL